MTPPISLLKPAVEVFRRGDLHLILRSTRDPFLVSRHPADDPMGTIPEVADSMPLDGHPMRQVRFTPLGQHPGQPRRVIAQVR